MKRSFWFGAMGAVVSIAALIGILWLLSTFYRGRDAARAKMRTAIVVVETSALAYRVNAAKAAHFIVTKDMDSARKYEIAADSFYRRYRTHLAIYDSCYKIVYKK